MGGGLLQIVSNGVQDTYITGNPQITFFKVVYRRHTNFSIECMSQEFTGTADFNNSVYCNISRNADLIHKMTLKVKLPAVGANSLWSGYTNNIGHALIKEIEIQIGGQMIDKHYGEWLDILDELNDNEEQRKMLYKYKSNASLLTNNAARTVYVPLKFWFCNNPGLALPLIALQYHEIDIKLTFRSLAQLVKSNAAYSSPSGRMTSAELLVDYIYLDTDERRRFAQATHEYLITQIQHTGSENVSSGATTKTVDLTYNHPVKALYWAFRTNTNTSQNAITGNNYFTYSNSSNVNHITDVELQLNGQNRFRKQDEDYFRFVQQKNHFNRISDKYVYAYSFALKPLEHQPSGTLNFSRIDTSTLRFTMNNSESREVLIFAENYNILRIMSGMGGLAYSS
jgi:hypothetical protein